MPTDLRLVFDTNVIVSALLLRRSPSRRAFDKALGEGKLLLSSEVAAELSDVLGRQSFDRYVTDGERMRFFARLQRVAEFVEVTESVTACRDPRDNKVLELALGGRATCIVSGDRDLLTLHPFRGIPILSPAAFLERTWIGST